MKIHQKARLLCFALVAALMSGCIETVSDTSFLYLKPETVVYVSPTFLNLRECPSVECKILSTLKQGQELKVAKQQGNWSQVKVVAAESSGWVSNTYISKIPPQEHSADITSRNTSPKENIPSDKPQEEWASPGETVKKPEAAMPEEEWALPEND